MKKINSIGMRSAILCAIFACGIVISIPAGEALAQSDGSNGQVLFGFKIRAGGRFDNVRMCVATPTGTKGGPAADISLFSEFDVGDNMSLHVDLPVFRPILFGLAFKMLQFEPSVTLRFRRATDGDTVLVAGPTLGVSLHYGPDYKSERAMDKRGPSFFALGPMIGGYFGLDFTRPNKTFNFELGLTPYVTPLLGVNDSENHKGVVIGGLLDGSFKFDPR